MKLWAAVAASSVISVGLTLLYTAHCANNSKPQPLKTQKKKKVPREIIDEQLARNIAFLGAENVEKIRDTSVAVVGAGGVGSWACTMLVRSGFGKVTIIDFDQVTLSSLNRHACATLEDVGTSKVNCLASYLERIAPWIDIEPINCLWTKDQASLLNGVDYVVDCIDNVDTKVDLLEYCVKNNIPVISSMGASTKADPRRIEIADLSNTFEDPLSKVCRVKLTRRGVKNGITCVFSSEKPGKDKAKLLDIDQSQIDKGDIDQLSVLKGFRIRTLPVLGPIPAIFGLTIATHLITLVGNYKSVYDPVAGGKPIAPRIHGKQFQSMHRRLRTQLERFDWLIDNQNPVSAEDIEYLMTEVWRNKSIDDAYGNLWVTIWDPSLPKTLGNIVPVTKKQLDVHEQEVISGGKPLESIYSVAQLEMVESRRSINEWYEKWR